MIVVVPVCHKDAHLAKLNLEWVKELEGSVHYKAILSHDRSFNAGDLLSGFKEYFSGGIEEFIYDPWKGSQNWPVPQNYAWQKAARYMPKHHDCWLWWEQDAVPIKKDWLKLMEAEYAKINKPVLGHIRNGFTCGVMIYPENVGVMCVSSLLTIDKPWDTVLCDLARRKIADTDLIQHGGKGHNVHFNGEIELSDLQPSTAIFHPCKDGSLHKALSENTADGQLLIPPSNPKQNILPDLTVVITNFKRPELVTKAFESCLRVGISNIIISASGCDNELAKVHSRFKELKPDVVITSIPNDLGCNEMWLRGVKLAKTKWVHILHDDDMLMPSFAKLEKIIKENPNVDFYHWDGAKHGPKGMIPGVYRTYQNKSSGPHRAEIMYEFFLNDSGFTLSPVAGLFPKFHIVEILEECEENFNSKKFCFRSPRMMVGNDLMIWLRAVEKFKTAFYVNEPLVSYGHWNGSASFKDSIERANGHASELLPIYKATRNYFLNGPDLNESRHRLVHCYSNYIPIQEGAAERMKHAMEIWKQQYNTGIWSVCKVDDDKLPRLFDDGFRRVPYLKDMVNYCLCKSNGDFYVLTNTDVIPSQRLTHHIVHALKKHECCFSYRRDISKTKPILNEKETRILTSVYAGADLFAFSKSWWQQNEAKLPDMIYATEAWDYVLRILMAESGGKTFYNLIYHTKHDPECIRNRESKSQKHNRRLADDFLMMRGIYPYWRHKEPYLVDMNPK